MKKNILSLVILLLSIGTFNSCGGDDIAPIYTHDPNAVGINTMIGYREGTATISLQNGQYTPFDVAAATSLQMQEMSNMLYMKILEPEEIISNLMFSAFKQTSENEYTFDLGDIAPKEFTQDNIPTYFSSWYKEYPNLSRVVYHTLSSSEKSYNHLTKTMSFTLTAKIEVYALENNEEILITGTQGISYTFKDLKVK